MMKVKRNNTDISVAGASSGPYSFEGDLTVEDCIENIEVIQAVIAFLQSEEGDSNDKK